MRKRTIATWLAMVGSSCTTEEPPVMVRTPTIVTHFDATEAIADSVCALYERCGVVGSGNIYESPRVCRDQVGASTRRLVDARDCVQGIDRVALQACLDHIAQNDCSAFPAPRDTKMCGSNALCLDTD